MLRVGLGLAVWVRGASWPGGCWTAAAHGPPGAAPPGARMRGIGLGFKQWARTRALAAGAPLLAQCLRCLQQQEWALRLGTH